MTDLLFRILQWLAPRIIAALAALLLRQLLP